MTGSEIRQKFLDYFEKHDHKVVRSSSLVPRDDPTLLFTNAGMVQFKRTFLGEEKRNYDRAATSQKCVRAGGKHNDLENVGFTARHHTFFEMLGNFSFGDYFKEKAIEFAWDLLTNGYGFPPEKLWVSIYLDDDEAHDLWEKNIGVPRERILRFGEDDNFWAMGDTGPCGPCSEVHIDRGDTYGCDDPNCGVGCECGRYLEIWNLVFMQFNRDAAGKMTPLPKPSIDTGMGLERIVSVIQDAPNNYETDLILPIIRRTEELSAKKLGDREEYDVAMKVIADHSRAAAFLIGDGVLPSNEGRGYVLRRIMRRAIRFGRNIGLEDPFLHDTSSVVVDCMKDVYPELSDAEAFIKNTILNEEMRFSGTLDHGLKILNETLSELDAEGETRIPGGIIFKLYDTYGFPVDIVRDVVRDRNMELDMEGFDNEMRRQKEKSRSVTSFAGTGEAFTQLSARGIIPEFTGYETHDAESSVILIVRDGKEVESAQTGDSIEIVTEKTPFYGESGGQAGDTGKITADGLDVAIEDTIKDPAGLIVHKGKVVSGRITKGRKVALTVDSISRAKTACNHTATHILHAVLKEVLGEHVKQSGSLVAPDRLRFDFTHFSQIDPDDLDEIERRVNAWITRNTPVKTVSMNAEDAFRSGAVALFEEKYGDTVRVVSLGDFSRELCGGTHTESTGNIGLFKIVGESNVAAGIRRLEALTGAEALTHTQKIGRAVREAAALVKEKPEDLPARIEKILAAHRALEKELERAKLKMAVRAADESGSEIRTINGVKVLAKKVEVDSQAALRDLADRFKDRLQSGIVVLGGVADGKAILTAMVTGDLTKRFHAGNIIKETAARVGGGGGGRPDMAQAGGSKPENLDKALENVYKLVESMQVL